MIVIRKPVACNLIHDVLLELELFGVVPKHRQVARSIQPLYLMVSTNRVIHLV